MASKRDAVADVAELLIRHLETQRRLGPPAYPLTVAHLLELAQSAAPPAQLEKAIGKRSFQQRVVIARAKHRDAPIALLEDLEALAGSAVLLEFLLTSLRTPSNQAFSPSQLKAKTARKLQPAFQAALLRQMEESSLPAGVGWITIHRSKKLFLLADLHRGQHRSDTPLAPTPLSRVQGRGADAPATEPVREFADRFEKSFAELDRQEGGHNFVSLVSLRAQLPLPRETFDAELQNLRRAGHYGLSAAEGRHGLTPEERAAAIMEDGTLLLYVSRKTP